MTHTTHTQVEWPVISNVKETIVVKNMINSLTDFKSKEASILKLKDKFRIDDSCMRRIVSANEFRLFVNFLEHNILNHTSSITRKDNVISVSGYIDFPYKTEFELIGNSLNLTDLNQTFEINDLDKILDLRVFKLRVNRDINYSRIYGKPTRAFLPRCIRNSRYCHFDENDF